MLPLESVPNFSEGRDRATIDAIGAALAAHARAARRARRRRSQPLGVHARRRRRPLVEALVAGVEVARERIDLRATRARTRGSARPTSCRSSPLAAVRHGAGAAGGARARRAARRARAAGLRLRAARCAGPAFYRRGGVEGLQRGSTRASSSPTSGPARIDPSVGGVIVGARRPLIAFNVNLRGTLEAAREIADASASAAAASPACARSASTCRGAGLVQVSMNVEDWEAAALHEIVARIARRGGAARGGGDRLRARRA